MEMKLEVTNAKSRECVGSLEKFKELRTSLKMSHVEVNHQWDVC